MDFLNKSWQQLRDLFLSLTPGARITTALLTVATVVSIAYLFQLDSAGGDLYLYGGTEFSEAELAAIETALGESGLTGAVRHGYRLKVPRGQTADYLQAIAKGGATPISASQMDNPDRSFNPLLTSEQLNHQEKARLQAKIAKMLGGTNEIQDIAVEFSEHRKGGLQRKVERSALVTARAKGSRPLSDDEIRSIRTAARAAIGGMESQDIVVFDQNTNRSHVGSADDDLANPSNNVFAVTKRLYENDWREKIKQALQSYGAVNVQVNVEIDETLNHVEQLKELNDPVMITTDTEKETTESRRTAQGGRPGVFSNTGAANGQSTVADVGEVENKATKNRESSESRVGGRITSKEMSPLAPQRVSVSIGIPEEFYKRLWARRNPATDGEPAPEMTLADLQALEAEIEPAVQARIRPLIKLPTTTGEDFLKHVVVDTDYEIPEDTIANPGISENAFSWLAANWQTLGLIGLGLAGLVFLRGMVKSTADPLDSDAGSNANPGAASDRGVNGEAEGEDAGRPKRSFQNDEPSLKNELSDLIHDDPNGAAAVLKQWIGEAA